MSDDSVWEEYALDHDLRSIMHRETFDAGWKARAALDAARIAELEQQAQRAYAAGSQTMLQKCQQEITDEIGALERARAAASVRIADLEKIAQLRLDENLAITERHDALAGRLQEQERQLATERAKVAELERRIKQMRDDEIELGDMLAAAVAARQQLEAEVDRLMAIE